MSGVKIIDALTIHEDGSVSAQFGSKTVDFPSETFRVRQEDRDQRVVGDGHFSDFDAPALGAEALEELLDRQPLETEAA